MADVRIGDVLFTGDYQDGKFVRREVRCPNCGARVEEQTVLGAAAYLLCPSNNKGCIKPIKSFGTETEMRDWLERTWQSAANICARRRQ